MKNSTNYKILVKVEPDICQARQVWEKQKTRFFLFFIGVSKTYPKCKNCTENKFGNTSNHQNFMSMETKKILDMKIKKRIFVIFTVV